MDSKRREFVFFLSSSPPGGLGLEFTRHSRRRSRVPVCISLLTERHAEFCERNFGRMVSELILRREEIKIK